MVRLRTLLGLHDRARSNARRSLRAMHRRRDDAEEAQRAVDAAAVPRLRDPAG